ncbi:hypothetical protein JIN85_14290 [Luteolibacter pohnpeiensis]|uniref:Uncharacterized protein n=1 Tax=Luteolibacter pohnpeiensis TaxID=454153 RepID=A0A934S852_9BACT|nr:DR2241 family protein [Luteolibacter pohnpeiensis]MBK1883588.1 hypothetical protein [Luteolibacter pohnpeiensis]
MNLTQHLAQFLNSGGHRIGQIEIRSNPANQEWMLCHVDDADKLTDPEMTALEIHRDPFAARDLSTFAADGSYRFTKGQTNLISGWIMILSTVAEIRQALDLFYPAAVGLWVAHAQGSIAVENLRDKLNRQTGMYRSARFISDAGAQELVTKICGPAHQCAKRILWQIDEDTPLNDSEASRFNGIPGKVAENAAIPLLCREACNHFVSECKKVSSAERKAASNTEA